MRDPTDSDANIYGATFWLAYSANLMLVCANALTFRFAEFIASINDPYLHLESEALTGRIIRAGLFAAVIARLWMGRAIDRYGERRVWLGTSVFYIASALVLPLCHTVGWTVWLSRIGYAVGLAGMFSCSIVHIQNQVPPHRRTEVIGSLGSSGFVGTILGTQLGDFVFQHWLPPMQFNVMFGLTALFGILHSLIVIVLTWNDKHQPPHETHSAFHLLRRHWPGMILLVAATMGSGFVVTTVFLTRYATSLNLRGIGTFFLGYSVTAFCCRWLFRNWGQSAGRHRMVLFGLAGMTIGHWLFLTVNSDWLFLLPAVASGFGHALLFPAVVSLGAGRFPVQFRGSGTTLVLGFTELGTALAAPLLGWLIDRGNLHQPGMGFQWMFLAAGTFTLFTGVLYGLTTARHPDLDPSFAVLAELGGPADEGGALAVIEAPELSRGGRSPDLTETG